MPTVPLRVGKTTLTILLAELGVGTLVAKHDLLPLRMNTIEGLWAYLREYKRQNGVIANHPANQQWLTDRLGPFDVLMYAGVLHKLRRISDAEVSKIAAECIRTCEGWTYPEKCVFLHASIEVIWAHLKSKHIDTGLDLSDDPEFVKGSHSAFARVFAYATEGFADDNSVDENLCHYVKFLKRCQKQQYILVDDLTPRALVSQIVSI